MPIPQFLGGLKLSAGEPYQSEELTARIERYVERRREHGFYEARVSAAPVMVNDDRTVNLLLTVSQGPHVRVVFTGDPLPGDRREDLVPIARENSVDEDLLEDATNRIEEYLRSQGFRDAAAPHTREERNGELVITFAVNRGRAVPRRPRRHHRQRGDPDAATLQQRCACDSASRSQWRRSTATSPGSRRSTGARVSQRCRVDASDDPVSRQRRDQDVGVALSHRSDRERTDGGQFGADRGEQRRWRGRSRDGLGLQPGSRFSSTQLALDRDAIELQYANRGYQSATVDTNPELSADGTSAEVVFTVHEGPRILVDHVLIVGNERTQHGDDRARAADQAGRPARPRPRSARASGGWRRSGCSAARASPSSGMATRRAATCW